MEKSFARNRRLLFYFGLCLTLVAISITVGFLLKYYLAARSPSPKQAVIKWITYTNDKQGYSLQYPDGWMTKKLFVSDKLAEAALVNFSSKDATPLTISGFSILVASDSANLSLMKWLQQNPENGVLRFNGQMPLNRVVSLNNLLWEKIDNNVIDVSIGGVVRMALVVKGKIYIVIIHMVDPRLMESIVKSFKVMDP